jgi:ubiquinone/menaquinone biosynthesis C-methylase UbiE
MSQFSGVLGSDYELILQAIPHRQQLQKRAGEVVCSQSRPLRILELGCGPGYLTVHLVDEDVFVVAVDNEPVMISQAQDILDTHIQNNRVELVEDDIINYLSVAPANSFDVVVSGYTLHNFSSSNRHDIHAEILRVLRPDGLFVNADKYAQKNQKHQEALNWQLQQFMKVFSAINRQDLVSAWTNNYLHNEHPDIVMREADTIIELLELGFSDVVVTDRTYMEAILVAKKVDNIKQ